ncbi:unnamed protein product [Clonostachys rosea]|uniref:FAD dependent oxidoreductase domain-containing protein n=1 Tax=Bionectria ochroleuca TaxID=29856 RepID=A0ABY6U0Q8_BIOOC|nr:unnamed protein product [Clonostachys rosea]
MSPTENGFAGPAENGTFKKGVRVAVIGAGVSGVCTGVRLFQQGASVVVFERSQVSSGVWHFDPRIDSNSVAYPSKEASLGEYETSLPGQFLPRGTKNGYSKDEEARLQDHALNTTDREALEVSFAPPGPCYSGLKNNIPTRLLYSNLKLWPSGTKDNVPHWEIEKYIQDIGAESDLDKVTLYNTRVETARKSDDGKKWLLRTITLLPREGTPQIVERAWEFDAVVVCSGHYNLPRIPDFPGLPQLKQAFEDRVIHSKEYRNPDDFRDKNILVIGGATSASDICRELDGVAKTVYQSTRGGKFDHPETIIPHAVKRVGEVGSFVLDKESAGENLIDPLASIPGQVLLRNGETIRDLHHIIIATGYLTSFPFLSQFHGDSVPIENATPDLLVTSEANMVHNLHKDIFYIEDPSLSFVGIPYYVATFSVFDFQAEAVARVLTGKSKLASRQVLRDEYNKKIASRGRGRNFHSLADEGAELAYVRDLADSVNKGAHDSKADPMKGHSKEWLDSFEKYKLWRNGLKKGTVSLHTSLEEFISLQEK